MLLLLRLLDVELIELLLNASEIRVNKSFIVGFFSKKIFP